MGLADLPASLLLCVVDHIHTLRDLNSLVLSLRQTNKSIDRNLYLQARDIVIFRNSGDSNLDRSWDLNFIVDETDPYGGDDQICLTKLVRHVSNVKDLLAVYRINRLSKEVSTHLTVLQWAAALNDIPVMRLILAEPGLSMEDMTAAVHVAVLKRSPEALRLLLTYEDIDLNREFDGEHLVQTATDLRICTDRCTCDANKVICGLLAMDARVNLDSKRHGMRSLLRLIQTMTDEDVQELLRQRGPDTMDWTGRDSLYGDTVLHAQVRITSGCFFYSAHGVLRCATIADAFPWMLTAQNDEGETPLMVAVSNSNSAHYSDISPQACKLLCKRLSLVEKQRQIDRRNKKGMTLLMEAIGSTYRCPLSVIECLVNGGMDLRARDRYGRTALMYATRCHRAQVVDLLLRMDPSLIADRDYGGWTAYMWAMPLFPTTSRCSFEFSPRTTSGDILLFWGADRDRARCLLKPVTRGLRIPISACRRALDWRL